MLSCAHSPLPSFLHSSIIPEFRILTFNKKGGKENSRVTLIKVTWNLGRVFLRMTHDLGGTL